MQVKSFVVRKPLLLPFLSLMNISNVAVQRFFVGVVVLANLTGISDLQVNGFHMALKNIRTSKTFNTLIALVSLTHMVDWKDWGHTCSKQTADFFFFLP